MKPVKENLSRKTCSSVRGLRIGNTDKKGDRLWSLIIRMEATCMMLRVASSYKSHNFMGFLCLSCKLIEFFLLK